MLSESIKAPHVVVFLRQLLHRIPGRLLIVCDGLAAHRSKLVKAYICGLEGRIQLERLPAYAPELNPAEYLWAHLKQHEIPDDCANCFTGKSRLALNPNTQCFCG